MRDHGVVHGQLSIGENSNVPVRSFWYSKQIRDLSHISVSTVEQTNFSGCYFHSTVLEEFAYVSDGFFFKKFLPFKTIRYYGI
jgi:hypothetical protein